MRHSFCRKMILLSIGLTAPHGCTKPDSESFLVDANTDLSDGSMSTPTAEAGSNGWGCLANPQPFVPAGSAPARIEYRIRIMDFVQQIQVPNLHIAVCSLLDVDCETPIPATVKHPDDQDPRLVSLDLPFGFTGYLRITSPPINADAGNDLEGSVPSPGYIPIEYYFGGPIVGSPENPNLVFGEPILSPSLPELTDFFHLLGASFLPSSEVVAVRTLDCNNQRAPGVRLELAPNSSTPDSGFSFTFIAGIPKRTDPPAPTDVQGVTGFAFVATDDSTPSTVALRGIAPTGIPYPRDYEVARLRANRVTLFELRPDSSWGK